MSPLATHVLPKSGYLNIENVDQLEIVRILKPIWHTKPSTAEKALNCMSLTLQYVTALVLDVDMQASKKAKALLGEQRHKVEHIPSLPYNEMPEFYLWLKSKETRSALSLRFLILTVARTSEVRFVTFDEIENDVWKLGEERTKNSRGHRIPLTSEALDLVAVITKTPQSPYLFPTNRGVAASDAAMAMLPKRDCFTARPHVFRASFRTWVEEQTNTPFEVKEA